LGTGFSSLVLNKSKRTYRSQVQSCGEDRSVFSTTCRAPKFLFFNPTSRPTLSQRTREGWGSPCASDFRVQRLTALLPVVIFHALLIRFRGATEPFNRKVTVSNQKNALNNRTIGSARHRKLALFLWGIFAVGVLIEIASPRLKIENNAFVMPPISGGQAAALQPGALVRRERWTRGVSGVLTLGGALALGVFYRRTLLSAVKGSSLL